MTAWIPGTAADMDEAEALSAAEEQERYGRQSNEAGSAPGDRIPTIDDDEPVASYPDWTPEGTRIVQYVYGAGQYPGIRVGSRREAKVDCVARFGRIYEANYTKDRAFFRVRRAG